jgi:hypothetical protein
VVSAKKNQPAGIQQSMKVITLLALGLLASAGFAQTPPTPAPPRPESILNRPEITVALAEKDIQQGRFRFFTYGLMQYQHRGIAAILRKDHGIEYQMAAGCVVSSELVKRVREYNDHMEKAVRKKFGKASSELYEEAKKKYQEAEAAKSAGA